MNNRFLKYNILVTGAKGQLGREIQYLVENSKLNIVNEKENNNLIQKSKFFFVDKSELDITKKIYVEKFIEKHNINIIINCAAYTAVDKAELDKENADKVNHLAVKYMTNIAKEQNILLIHISTDYVFDGKTYKPYNEKDQTNPQNVYGITKLKGEETFIKSGARGIIIRTSWVYSNYGNNFVKTMLRLSKDSNSLNIIYDQIGTPTYAKDLAKVIFQIISYELEITNKKDRKILQNSILKSQCLVKIYHYSNEGVCSWFDFAKAIFEIKNIDIKINPIITKEYPSPVVRPYYSLLDKSKIKQDFDIVIPYWKDSLKKMLKGN